MSLLNVVGLPGSGKTYLFAGYIQDVLSRNKKYFEKTGVIRPVYTNIHLNHEIQNEYKDFIRNFYDSSSLFKIQNADIFIDEIAGYFNARDWELLSEENRQWLMMHEHYGVDLYCCTQNWKTIESNFRRLTEQLIHVSKICGNKRPHQTRPPVKFIWGMINAKNVSRKSFDKEDWEFEYDDIIGKIFFITKENCMAFDTTQDLDFRKTMYAKHIEKVCNECSWKGDVYHR